MTERECLERRVTELKEIIDREAAQLEFDERVLASLLEVPGVSADTPILEALALRDAMLIAEAEDILVGLTTGPPVAVAEEHVVFCAHVINNAKDPVLGEVGIVLCDDCRAGSE